MQKLNRTTFFAYVRKAPFGNRLSQQQVDGMNAILDKWQASQFSDVRWLAYMLATVFHETGATMQPVRETYATSDKQAVARLENAWKSGKLSWVKTPYWRVDKNGQSWFGRGLVQITHKANYQRLGDLLGIALVKNPSLALQMPVALDIMFEGMTHGVSSKGDFTGKSLENYFNETTDDPKNARRIINGTDKASLIAGYHRNFLDAINAALETYIDDGRTEDYIAPDVDPKDAEPDDIKPRRSKSLWTIITGLFAGGGAAALNTVSDGLSRVTEIDNAFSLVAFLAILAVGGVLAWLIMSERLRFMHGKA